MKDRLRTVLGLLIIIIGIFYQGGIPINFPIFKPKLEKPEDYIVEIVENLPEISDSADANKLAGTFFAMSEGVPETDLQTNLQVQYFLDFVGKNTIGKELMNADGSKKYPDFSPTAAELIAQVIGPQTETTVLSAEEKEKLSKLFYGFSWKLYDKTQDNVFESYKSKASASIAEYNKEDDGPEPDDDTECICEGKGYIIHGDGHKTDCPCIESGEVCKHNPKCGGTGDLPEAPEEPPKKKSTNSSNRSNGILRRGWLFPRLFGGGAGGTLQ
jgi:hypothetical protein